MIRFLLLSIALIISGCRSEEALLIKSGENSEQLIVTNVSNQTISYFPTLLDHPLDIWNLAAGKAFEGKELTGFVLFLVDKNGVRHLRCGSKDGPPPGKPTLLSLAHNESVRFAHAPIDKFTACGGALEGPFRWQVVNFRVVVERKVNFANPDTFSILNESNTVEAGLEVGNLKTKS